MGVYGCPDDHEGASEPDRSASSGSGMLTVRHATWKSPSESGRESWEKDERKEDDEAQDVADVVDENMDVVDDQSNELNEEDEPPESPRGK